MISFILLIISAILFPGIISITKAKMQGRKGPGIFQPWKDIFRLLKKGTVYSTTTSLIFKIGPVVYFSSIFLGLMFIPFNNFPGFISFKGDIFFFVYLLGIGKFLSIISALDTGSGFEGMGANREALYSMLAEPAFFILLATISLINGSSSFVEMYAYFDINDTASWVFIVLAVYILVQIAMIENSRLPVDDPKTHLELTMVHEVMVLDNSGFDLGIIQIAGGFKFALYGGIILNLFLSAFDLALIPSIILFLTGQILFAITVGLLESFRARLKMAYNPQFILSLSAIALLAFISAFLILKVF
jgi:formate hydrogenlyase subunit 4